MPGHPVPGEPAVPGQDRVDDGSMRALHSRAGLVGRQQRLGTRAAVVPGPKASDRAQEECHYRIGTQVTQREMKLVTERANILERCGRAYLEGRAQLGLNLRIVGPVDDLVECTEFERFADGQQVV